jgi:hypothetical protein
LNESIKSDNGSLQAGCRGRRVNHKIPYSWKPVNLPTTAALEL